MSGKELHILNGDSIAAGFKKHFPQADFLVWREVLCNGPIQYDLLNDNSIQDRISYLEIGMEAKIDKHLFEELKEVDLHKVAEITLWFEYDLFCQVNKMAAISWLIQQNFQGQIYSLDLKEFQKDDFVGLGQINPDYFPSIYKKRFVLDPKEKSYIDFMWEKISKGDHQLLPHLQAIPRLSYFNISLRTIAVFSNKRGLGAGVIEARILDTLKQAAFSKNKLIGKILSLSADLGYGDTQVASIINQLVEERTLVLKDDILSLS